jgi:hypothetical protein
VANTVTAGKKSSYSDTTITIKITHQANSDVTTPEKPSGSSTNNPPPTGTSPSATSTPTASGSTPTGSGAPKPTGTSTGSPSTDEDKPKGETKPEGEPEKPAGATGGSSTEGGESAPPPDAERRDLGGSNTADQPLTKRKLGLSGALWASWSRRNIQKD